MGSAIIKTLSIKLSSTLIVFDFGGANSVGIYQFEPESKYEYGKFIAEDVKYRTQLCRDLDQSQSNYNSHC